MTPSRDSKFIRFITLLGDLMILSTLWLVCSLPVFTLGASCAALYYSTVKVVRKGGKGIFGIFFRAFADNFLQGTALTALTALGILAVRLLGSWLVRILTGSTGTPAVHFAYLVLALIAIPLLHYLLSYIARFRAPLGLILRNTLIILAMNLPLSVGLMLLCVAIIALVVVGFPYTSYLVLLLPGAYAWGVSYPLERTYKKYLDQENENHENT